MERARRLASLLDELGNEIEQERSGLQRRMSAQSADAGFLDQCMENGDVPNKGDRRLGQLASALLNGEKRLGALRQQAVLVADLRREIDRFSNQL